MKNKGLFTSHSLLALLTLAPLFELCTSFQKPASFSGLTKLRANSLISQKDVVTDKKATTTTRISSSFGDIMSGMTGAAPAELKPPVELLVGTSLDPDKDTVDLVRIYKASKDGWSAVNFHDCVDGRGSCLVVALSKSGKRFGGFNPAGWMSTDDYTSSNAAFLWYLKNDKTPTRIPILIGGNTAVYDYATGGPCFGAADLLIGPPKAAVMGGFAGPDMENTAINAGSLRQGESSLGGCYDSDSGWPCRGSFGLVEVEVYCNGNIKREEKNTKGWWPF